jgi:tRNA (uracil-5-)-methyltransferase TRM9
MSEESYRRFKGVWAEPEVAAAYRDDRFSRSRRWRWTDRREQSILGGFLAGFEAGSRGLDVPCGTGRLAPLFRRAGLLYAGGDVSMSMLQLARQREGHGIVLGADALELPFRPDAFDFLTAVRLLHRIRAHGIRVAMLREMARVTRGPLIVTYYARWNLRGVQRWLKGKDPGLSLGRIMADFRGADLRLRCRIPLRRWTQQQWFFVLEKTPGDVSVVTRGGSGGAGSDQGVGEAV